MKIKKVVFLIILVLIITRCFLNDKKNNSLDEMNLNGNIFRIVETNTEFIPIFWTHIKIYQFDFEGNLIGVGSASSFKKNLNETDINGFEEFFEYGTNGIKTVRYNLSTDLKFHDIYQYDNLGNLIAVLRNDDAAQINPEGDNSKLSTFKYDYNGNLIEKYYWSEDHMYQTEKFNDTGNIIETLHNNKSGKVIKKDIFKYDHNGNLIEKLEFEFNNNESPFQHSSQTTKYEYTFDKNDNAVEEKEFVNDSLYRITKRKFDKNNNAIEEKEEYVNYSPISITTRKFDEKSNWIEQKWVNDNVVQSIDTRKIEYFNSRSDYNALVLKEELAKYPTKSIGRDKCRDAVIMHCTNLDRNANRNYIPQLCEYNGNGNYLVQLYDMDSGLDFVFSVTVDDSCNIVNVKRQ